MKYTSDKIKEIITSPSAMEGLDYIQPIYSDATTALWILQANGALLDDIKEMADEIALQVFPQTATWGLPYWEESYGLPINNTLPIDIRRNHILSKKLVRAPANPAKVAEILSNMSMANVRIRENIAKNSFQILYDEIPDSNLRKNALKKLDKMKPAHIIYHTIAKTGIQFLNQNQVDLERMIISLGLKNWGTAYVILDGSHLLNGEFLLMIIRSSPTLHSLRMSMEVGNKRFTSGCRMVFGFKQRNKMANSLLCGYALRFSNLGRAFITLDSTQQLKEEFVIGQGSFSFSLNVFKVSVRTKNIQRFKGEISISY